MSNILLTSSLNSTINQESPLVSTTTIPSTTSNPYDHQGAALYIAVILVWYSTGLAMMLFLQVRPRTLQQQFVLDSSNSSRRDRIKKMTANPFTNYRDVQADHTTKQILTELKDPERRQRLWKIYYGSPDRENESHERYYQTIMSDGATIDRIKRKLTDMHRMDSTDEPQLPISSQQQQILTPPPSLSSSSLLTTPVPSNEGRLSIVGFDSAKFFSKRFSIRRPTNNILMNARHSISRAHPQHDSQSAVTTVELEPLVDGKQGLSVPTGASRLQRNNRSSERFTVEQVSDKNKLNATINEETTE